MYQFCDGSRRASEILTWPLETPHAFHKANVIHVSSIPNMIPDIVHNQGCCLRGCSKLPYL